jgi:hypothetical protein
MGASLVVARIAVSPVGGVIHHEGAIESNAIDADMLVRSCGSRGRECVFLRDELDAASVPSTLQVL